jgi:hypothetical protein
LIFDLAPKSDALKPRFVRGVPEFDDAEFLDFLDLLPSAPRIVKAEPVTECSVPRAVLDFKKPARDALDQLAATGWLDTSSQEDLFPSDDDHEDLPEDAYEDFDNESVSPVGKQRMKQLAKGTVKFSELIAMLSAENNPTKKAQVQIVERLCHALKEDCQEAGFATQNVRVSKNSLIPCSCKSKSENWSLTINIDKLSELGRFEFQKEKVRATLSWDFETDIKIKMYELRVAHVTNKTTRHQFFDNLGRPTLTAFGNSTDRQTTAYWPGTKVLFYEGRERFGHMTGEEILNYESGQPAAKGQWDKSLRRIDLWYQDGKPAETIPMDKGKPYGKHQWWHSNGQLAGSATWKNGILDGTLELWFPDGNLAAAGSFKAGHINTPLTAYTSNGKKSRSCKSLAASAK